MNLRKELSDSIAMPGMAVLAFVALGHEIYSYVREEFSRLINPIEHGAIRHFVEGNERLVETAKGDILQIEVDGSWEDRGVLVQKGRQYFAGKVYDDMNSYHAGIPMQSEPSQIRTFFDYKPLNDRR
ncbi:hypothetical protein HYZ97_01290 [Candidatus Pacearchaeota archaeon]|nr:hypothetical protein [Candidatus Pacearchaeota archaeon]